jgi:hypothetical protein
MVEMKRKKKSSKMDGTTRNRVKGSLGSRVNEDVF